MTLAAYVEHHHLGHRFTVAAASAIWPGSHAESNLHHDTQCQAASGQHDQAALLQALDSDLELAPHSVFAYRIRKILREEARDILQTPSWAEQPWHVDASCAGCPYLGHPRPNATGDAEPHPHHCMPTALDTNHLCRVAFLSPAARESLETAQITTVEELSSLDPDDAAFGSHPTLRAGRIILPARADALLANEAVLPEQGATSALLPRWADLRVYVTAHFDSTSALTTVLAWQAYSSAPRGYGIDYSVAAAGQGLGHQGPSIVVTQARSLEAERDALLQFLHGIDGLLAQVQAADDARRLSCANEHAGWHPDPAKAHPDSKVQFFIWDQLQYDHIARVVGRHLAFILADQSLRRLAWLFPPEEVLENPKLIGNLKGAPLALISGQFLVERASTGRIWGAVVRPTNPIRAEGD
jgi:DNA replication ATP-dependent helicase Dna2